MKIFGSISRIATLVLLCTLLSCIEIEADRVLDEGTLPDLARSANTKGGHHDDLGVETTLLGDEENNKDTPAPKMSAKMAIATSSSNAKKAAASKISAAAKKAKSSPVTAKTSTSVAMITEKDKMDAANSRKLLSTGGSVGVCDICYVPPLAARTITEVKARGRIEADRRNQDQIWAAAKTVLGSNVTKVHQACEIKDLGFTKQGSVWHGVNQSSTLYVQPCATLPYSASGEGNLEASSTDATVGQCKEVDSDTTRDSQVAGDFYTERWVYTHGLRGTRQKSDQASTNPASSSEANALHAHWNFPDSRVALTNNRCRKAVNAAGWGSNQGYIMSGVTNKRTGTANDPNGTSCLKDPDMRTSGTVSRLASGGTQRATVEFTVVDQNNYYQEDVVPPPEVLQNATASDHYHGSLHAQMTPMDIEVCISNDEQARHFHPDELIPNVAKMFTGASPHAKFVVVTKQGGGTSEKVIKFDANKPSLGQQIRFKKVGAATKSVCVTFSKEYLHEYGGFEPSGASDKTAFMCKATPTSTTSIMPYDFPITQSTGTSGSKTHTAWKTGAQNAYYAINKHAKTRPRVVGSSDTYTVGGTVHTYNSRLRSSSLNPSAAERTIPVESNCGQKLQIELDDSVQGSLVVDIRATQVQSRSQDTATTKELVYYSSTQTMINFAPYHQAGSTDTQETSSTISNLSLRRDNEQVRLGGLATSNAIMDTTWTANARLQAQTSGGLGGQYGILETHPANNKGPGSEAAMRLYDNTAGSQNTRTALRYNSTMGQNAPRLFKADGTVDRENKRVKFSLTFKDETKCHYEKNGEDKFVKMQTPSAIEKRFFQIGSTTEDEWQSLNRFWLSSQMTPTGQTSPVPVYFERDNTKQEETDIFYGIRMVTQVAHSGLTRLQVKEILKKMEIHPSYSHNTQMCGRYRLKAVVDVMNMRSCGRHTEVVEVSAAANWPTQVASRWAIPTGSPPAGYVKEPTGCAAKGSGQECAIWNIAPSSKLGVLTDPIVKFRQITTPSKWCELHTSGATCTKDQAKNVVSVVLGNEPTAWNTVVDPGYNLRIIDNSSATTPVAASKAWMPTWNSDREAEATYGYVPTIGSTTAAASQEHKIPQLTWFSTMEVADFNEPKCDSSIALERSDVMSVVSTATARWLDTTGSPMKDASYVHAWYSYRPEGNLTDVNTKKDSFMVCQYLRDLAQSKRASSRFAASINHCADGSSTYSVPPAPSPDAPGQGWVKVQRFTVFPSWAAYDIARGKNIKKAQGCDECSSTLDTADPNYARSLAACKNSINAIFGRTDGSCPTGQFAADDFEKMRKYYQTFAGMGENGLELVLRSVVHKLDFSATIQTFDFIDRQQSETTKVSLDTPSAVYSSSAVGWDPRRQTSATNQVSVIVGKTWKGRGANPFKWNGKIGGETYGLEWLQSPQSSSSPYAIGGERTIPHGEFKENGITGQSMALGMDVPKNLLDGVCATTQNQNVISGLHQYDRIVLDPSKNVKHCMYSADPLSPRGMSGTGVPAYYQCGTSEKCILARQNLDCSPSQGKDNAVVGMQLIVTQNRHLPYSERRDGPGSPYTLESKAKAESGADLKVGEQKCVVHSNAVTGKNYRHKPCYYADRIFQVGLRSQGATAKSGRAAQFSFTRKTKQTRRGVGWSAPADDTCYYFADTGVKNATFCPEQLFLTKDASHPSDKNPEMTSTGKEVYESDTEIPSEFHNDMVWTTGELLNNEGKVMNIRDAKARFKVKSDQTALYMKAGFDYTSDLWYYQDASLNDNTIHKYGETSADRKKRVGPMIKVYMKLRTCTKANQASNCAATPSASISKTSKPEQFHKNTDSGNTLSVSSVTGDVGDARTGALRVTVANLWDTHKFNGNDTKIERWQSSVKPGAYDKTEAPQMSATKQSYWMKTQHATLGSAVINHNTTQGKSYLYEQETRNRWAYQQASNSLSRALSFMLHNNNKAGNTHPSEVKLDFYAKHSDGSWVLVNDNWKVERWNQKEQTSERISDYKKYGVAGTNSQPHILMKNSWQMEDGVEQSPADKHKVFRPTVCTVKDANTCQQDVAGYQKTGNTLFVSNGRCFALEEHKLFALGGEVGSTGSRKIVVTPRQHQFMGEVKIKITMTMRDEVSDTKDLGRAITFPDQYGSSPPLPEVRTDMVQTAELFMSMRPVASAPQMAVMHPSVGLKRSPAAKNIALKEMTGDEPTIPVNQALGRSTLLKSDEADTKFSILPITAKNHERALMLYYGVIAGSIDDKRGTKENSKENQRTNLESPPYVKNHTGITAAEKALYESFMEEDVYLNIRVKNNAIILREFDETAQKPGSYILPLPDSKCAQMNKDYYAIRNADDDLTGNTVVKNPVDTSNPSQNNLPEKLSDQTLSQRTVDGSFAARLEGPGRTSLPKVGDSNWNGGKCFRMKVCTLKRNPQNPKQLMCVGEDTTATTGYLPRFMYQFPQKSTMSMDKAVFEFYLTQFRDKTISINEKGWATRSAAQTVTVYPIPELAGQYFDWRNATFSSSSVGGKASSIQYDWSYYKGNPDTGNIIAKPMSATCASVKFSDIFSDYKTTRVQTSSLYTSTSSAQFSAWTPGVWGSSAKLLQTPMISTGSEAQKCDKQLSIVPVKYLAQDMDFGADLTDLTLGNRLAGVPVKISVDKVEKYNKVSGTFGADDATEKAKFKWKHTDFVHSQACQTGGMYADNTKCNSGIMRPVGSSGRVTPTFKLKYDSAVPASTCQQGDEKNAAELRVTLKIEVSTTGTVGSTVVSNVEKRTILFVHGECAVKKGRIDYDWTNAGSAPTGAAHVARQRFNNADGIKGDVSRKATIEQVTLVGLSHLPPSAATLDATELEFEHSQNDYRNKMNPPHASLDCTKYDKDSAAVGAKWRIFSIGDAINSPTSKSGIDKPANCAQTSFPSAGYPDSNLTPKMTFASASVFSSSMAKIMEQKEAIGQRFGNATSEYLAAAASQNAEQASNDNFVDQLRYSCLSMKDTGCWKSSATNLPKCYKGATTPTHMCLDVKKNPVDKNHFSGFCVHNIKGENTNVWFDKARSRKPWKAQNDNMTPRSILDATTAPDGTVFMGEKDAETSIKINLRGKESQVKWPVYDKTATDQTAEKCNSVETTVTIGKLQIGKETCASGADCWKDLVNYDANDMYIMSTFGGGQNSNMVDTQSSGLVHKFTWQETTADNEKSMTIKLSEKARDYFFDASHQRHMMRTGLSITTVCKKRDRSDKVINAAQCASKKIFFLQTTRAGKWEFKGATTALSVNDFASGNSKTLTATIKRSLLPDDKKVLKLRQLEGGSVHLAQVYPKLKYNTNDNANSRFFSAYQMQVAQRTRSTNTATWGSPKSVELFPDLHAPGVFRAEVELPEIEVLKALSTTGPWELVQLDTTLYSRMRACSLPNVADSLKMKIQYEFLKRRLATSERYPGAATSDLYEYYTNPMKKGTDDVRRRFAYTAEFPCSTCAVVAQNNPTTSSSTRAKLLINGWDASPGVKTREIMAPSRDFLKNMKTIKVTIPESSKFGNNTAAGAIVGYLYATGPSCLKEVDGKITVATAAELSALNVAPAGWSDASWLPKCGSGYGRVLVVKRPAAGAVQQVVDVKLKFMGLIKARSSMDDANQIMVHAESTTQCMDSFSRVTVGSSDRDARPTLIVSVKDNKFLAAREHTEGTSVSHRVWYSQPMLGAGATVGHFTFDVHHPTPFYWDDSQNCKSDNYTDVYTGETRFNAMYGTTQLPGEHKSTCWARPSLTTGPRPVHTVISIEKKDAQQGAELHDIALWKGATDKKLYGSKLFQVKPTASQSGFCSNRQGGGKLKALTLREFTRELVYGKDKDGKDQRAACNAANPSVDTPYTNPTAVADRKSFLEETDTPSGSTKRFQSSFIKTKGVGKYKPAIKCARRETMRTRIRLNRNELLQCRDRADALANPTSLGMENPGGAKGAVMVTENTATKNIDYEYSVCASSTQARLGIPITNDECTNDNECCVGTCGADSTRFCDKSPDQTKGRCREASLMAFSNCINIKLTLNTQFNMWTGKAGNNPQTGVMCTMQVKKIEPTFQRGTAGKKAYLTITYEKSCAAKHMSSSDKKPRTIIGVYNKDDVHSHDGASGPLGMTVTSVSVGKVTGVDNFITTTTIKATTKAFDLYDGATFKPDAIPAASNTKFGFDMYMRTCTLDDNYWTSGNPDFTFPNGAFTATQMSGVSCSDAGKESFPASLDWRFTEYDATQALTIKADMLQFRTWNPSKGSKYFKDAPGRIDWWNKAKMEKSSSAGEPVKMLPTDALVIATGVNDASGFKGIRSFIKKATIMRAPFQAYTKTGALVYKASYSTAEKNATIDAGYEIANAADQYSKGNPGKHILADFFSQWKIPTGVTILTPKGLTWPDISSSDKQIKDFLYFYAKDSCEFNGNLYKLAESAPDKTGKRTFSVKLGDDFVRKNKNMDAISPNDVLPSCVCGTTAKVNALQVSLGSASSPVSRTRALRHCYYEFSDMFSGVDVINNGKHDLNGLSMLGATSGHRNSGCLKLSIPAQRGKTACAGTGKAQQAQILRFDTEEEKKAGSECSLKTMVSTSSLMMQAARGIFADVPYSSDANAYRAKCTAAYNDMSPAMYSDVDMDKNLKGDTYPTSESQKCASSDRFATTDSLMIGSGILNNLPNSRFSVKLETAIFDPISSKNGNPVCEIPELKCTGVGQNWEVKNLAAVATKSGVLDKTKTYILVQVKNDKGYNETNTNDQNIPLPAVTYVPPSAVKAVSYPPLAVSENEAVKLVDKDGKSALVAYDGSKTEQYPFGIEWETSVFAKRVCKGSGSSKSCQLIRLYAVEKSSGYEGSSTSGIPSTMEAVKCSPDDSLKVTQEIAAFKDGTKSLPNGAAQPPPPAPASRRLLGYSGDKQVATKTEANANGRKLLQYGLQYGYIDAMPNVYPGHYSTQLYEYVLTDGDTIIQTSSDPDSNAVATSTVNVIRDTEQSKKGNNHHGNHHDGHHYDDHHDDHHKDEDSVNALSIVLMVVVGVVICIVIIGFAWNSERVKTVFVRSSKTAASGDASKRAGKRNQADFRLI